MLLSKNQTLTVVTDMCYRTESKPVRKRKGAKKEKKRRRKYEDMHKLLMSKDKIHAKN